MAIEAIQLYGLYSKNISNNLRLDRRDISFDIFSFDMSNLGLFPFAGPHQLLNDTTWISRHEEQVFIDAIVKIKDKNYKGLVLIDYSEKWHPHFDFSSYKTLYGYLNNNICNSGKLYYDDDNYREDFYNYLYCKDSSLSNLDFELELYMKDKWNTICREFYEATIRGIKKAVPYAKIGFIDLPKSIYKNEDIVSQSPGVVGYGNRFDEIYGDVYNSAQRINNDLSWLWKLVDVLSPKIQAIRYSVEDGVSPKNDSENTIETNAAYISSNILESHRLQSIFGVPYVIPVFNHRYSSSPPYSRQPLNDVNFKQQLQLPFIAGANAIVLSYDEDIDYDNIIQNDYKDRVYKYLPHLTGRRYSGGSRTRPMGGLSNTGSDIKNIYLSNVYIEELNSFMPLQLSSVASSPLGGVDRRPVRIYTLWEDNFLSSSGNVNKFASWWRSSDGVSNLIDRMSRDYSLGFRRFMFYMPAGNQTNNPSYYSPNQWGPISSSRKQEIENILSNWIENRSDIEIIIMGGSKFEPNISKINTHEIDYDNAVPYDIVNNSLHKNYYDQNWQPWISIGASSIALHNPCYNDIINSYIELVINQSLANTKIYGSCLPLSSPEEINQELISFSPWIINYEDFLMLKGSSSFYFDPTSTEVGILLTPQMAFSSEDVKEMQDRGLIIYAAEGTVADSVIFSEDHSSSEYNQFSFIEIQGKRSDPIEGFGVSRYSSVNVGINRSDTNPPYEDFPLIAVANSVNGIFFLNSSLRKKDYLTVNITNPLFKNTGLPHATIEDTFEWVNSGLPSHLSQTRDSNLIQMGLNLSKTNSSAMSNVPPHQAKYILPCSYGVYDVFNSTVDFDILSDLGKRNFSIPYVTSAVYVKELNQVWVGGPGGILSIDINTYEIDEVIIDKRRNLQIKDIFVRNNNIYILDQNSLYIYNIDTGIVKRDPGIGWTSDVFVLVNFFNTNLAVGGEKGIYARKEIDDQWTLVKETSANVDSMIAPDAGFAIADSEIFYTTNGIIWNSIGTDSRSINGIVKYRNKIYVATDEGIYEDGGLLYSERVSLRLIDVFNNAEESRNIIVNDIEAGLSQVVAGLDDGRLITLNDLGPSVYNSGLNSIHKVIIVENDVWMFSYNSFKIKFQPQVRRLVSGKRL